MILKKYTSALNFRTLISVIISLIATWIAYKYQLTYNLDLTIISVAVVFPIVFTLGSAFQRREKALEHLGRAKGALASIKYCFSASKKISDADKEKVYSQVVNVKKQLITFLYSESNDKTELNNSIAKIQDFIMLHRESLGGSLSLRVYRLMRDVIMGIENTISIKVHRTPQSIRAYCELFIYIFPFYYAPTLIYNIGNASMGLEIGSTFGGSEIVDTTFLVYALNIIISFILISLFNVQEQIENPFDGDGMDDIKLENYELDY
ncbi:MAG: hypothetical protein ACJZ0Y_04840 [Cytophagales bacterium]|nr:MAG: hypothetical protein CND83_04015 [Rhodothermaeota bacterium MED-G19]